jgi:uncharacterized protein YjbJ (UPF0337 family)
MQTSEGSQAIFEDVRCPLAGMLHPKAERCTMKALPWIIAGTAIGAAITYVIVNTPTPEYATGSETVEGAARKAFGWGTKQRASGKGQSIAGSLKEGVGKITGDPDLADEGAADSLVGDAKDAAGKLGHALGETIHDLNR